MAFLRVSVRISPGRFPWMLPLYSNQTVVPLGLTASWSISTPTSVSTRRPLSSKP